MKIARLLFLFKAPKILLCRFEASEKLHELCDKIGIKNKLIKIDGKGHGNFTAEERTYIYDEIWKFFEEIGIRTSGE
jgi:hypothetical protein